jgi:chromodomain-helicase-DNA-binding protein 7
MKSELQKKEAKKEEAKTLAKEKAQEAAKAEAAENDVKKTDVENDVKKTDNDENDVKKTDNENDVKKADNENDLKKTDEDVVKKETNGPESAEEVAKEKPDVEMKDEEKQTEAKTEKKEEETKTTTTNELPLFPPTKKSKKSESTASVIQVEEFLVKFKNFSYLHCQWLTEEELYRGDKRIGQKVKRFKQKREKSGNVLEFCDEDPFNPDYVEVDRVLDASEHTDEVTGVVTKHYLVKWRSLPYEDCTWEMESDVDPVKIVEFQKWRYPPAEEMFYKKRPRKNEWKKWDVTPIYKNGNYLRPYQLEGTVRLGLG